MIKKWYSDRIINELISVPVLFWSQEYCYTHLDRGLLEIAGPTGLVTITSTSLQNSKSSSFYSY